MERLPDSKPLPHKMVAESTPMFHEPSFASNLYALSLCLPRLTPKELAKIKLFAFQELVLRGIEKTTAPIDPVDWADQEMVSPNEPT